MELNLEIANPLAMPFPPVVDDAFKVGIVPVSPDGRQYLTWCKVEYQVQEEVQRRITSGPNIPASALDTNVVHDTTQLLKLAVRNTNAILVKVEPL